MTEAAKEAAYENARGWLIDHGATVTPGRLESFAALILSQRAEAVEIVTRERDEARAQVARMADVSDIV